MVNILGMHIPSAIALGFLIGVVIGMIVRGKWG